MIELLMASIVVAMAGAMLMGVLIASNRSAKLRIEHTLLTQLAASQLSLIDDPLTDQTPTQGAFAPPLEDFTWSLTRTDAPLKTLAQATLTVSHDHHHADVVTYRRKAE